MSEELIYIVNGKKNNENKCKKFFWKKWGQDCREVTETRACRIDDADHACHYFWDQSYSTL